MPKLPDPVPIVYECVAYRQSQNPEAPWLLSFVAPAEELLSWSSIPRRTDHTLNGFQRTDDPARVLKAKAFFQLGINQSPTSLIIGIHPTSGKKQQAKLEFTSGTDSDSMRKGRLTILVQTDEDLQSAVARVKDQIQYRLLGAQGSPAVPAQQMAALLEDAEDQADEESEAQEDEALSDDSADLVTGTTAGDPDLTEESLELGRSLLLQLLARLEETDWCTANEKDIRDLARPATVIDGQHRILAADQCERNIPFSVCAIFNCPWPEQVFQFTVVNYTAKGIPDQFITANAALSLTKLELGVLQDRLVQAGVRVTEYELMKVVQFDKESPFFDLVNLTEKSSADKIGYRSMVRLARMYYQGKHPGIQQLLVGLYPDIPGQRGVRKRLDRWQVNDWGIFFKDFWRVAHKQYKDVKGVESGVSLWSPGQSNLLIGVVLEELQIAFLDHLAQQDVDLFFTVPKSEDPLVELRGRVQKKCDTYFGWVPAEFFAAKWELKSLSVGPGRKALEEVMAQFVKSKGKFQYGKSVFLTGQIG